MAKKTKHVAQPRDIERWLERASQQLMVSDYEGAMATARRVLRAPGASAAQRAEALGHIGTVHMFQEQFAESYAALTEALALTPDDSMLWYNRGMAARVSMRIGQSLRDFERAQELDANGIIGPKLAKEIAATRKMAEGERKLRGPNFTLDQLIVQEDLFQQAGDAMERGHWARAEPLFRQVIAIGDVLPQPWGNLGICLMMQRRFDEAEAALRRALEIDPRYAIARQNLAGMPVIRASGKLPEIRVTHPLKGQKKPTLTFLDDGKRG